MTASASKGAKPFPLYASLYVPDFPLAVLQRDGHRARSTVVAFGKRPNRFVCSADAAARECGVRKGMALAAAAARCKAAGGRGALRVLERDEGQERQVQQLLLELAGRVTPRFEDAAPGLVALDLAGLRDPYAAASELASGLDRLGLSANVAVSRNRFVSLCAARTQAGVTHVYPGQEAGFLQQLPLDTLPLEKQEIRTLARWGLRKVGELALLSEADLVERFGDRGARMARLARGREHSALRPYQPPRVLELSEDCDWGIEDLEALALILSGLIHRLCGRLHGMDQAAENLTVQLQLEGGGLHERRIDLPCPLGDAQTLLALAKIDLAAHPPGCAVEGVRIMAKPARRREVQQSLFVTSLPAPEKLEITLARLTGLVGAGRVGSPVIPDTRRPGVAVVEAFRPEKNKARRGRRVAASPQGAATGDGMADESQGDHRQHSAHVAETPPRSSLVFRCFRPSRAAEVTLRGDRPVSVQAQDVRGSVTACAGPWRVSGEWWTPEGWQYQEWDIEVDRHLYRACCERSTGQWFLAGEYD